MIWKIQTLSPHITQIMRSMKIWKGDDFITLEVLTLGLRVQLALPLAIPNVSTLLLIQEGLPAQ